MAKKIYSDLDIDGILTPKNINISSALNTNLSYCGVIDTSTVGENVVFGDVLYLKFSDGKWWKAKADTFTTTPAQRIAIESISANNSGKLLIDGFVRNDSWTFTAPQTYLSATTAGSITTTQPATAGNQIQVVGIAISSTKLHFKPSLDVGER